MRVFERKTLFKGKYLRMLLISYEDKRGKVRQWEAVGRVDCAGVVAIAPVTGRGELLLVRQYRPALDRDVIELPAGLIPHGEHPAQAARRELIEETGHVPGELIHLSEGVISTGINTETWEVYLALDVREAPEEVRREHPPDETEDIEVIKLPLSGIYEALEPYRRRGNAVDLRIFGILEMVKRRLRGAGPS